MKTCECPQCTFYSDDPDEMRDHFEMHLVENQQAFTEAFEEDL